MNQLILIKWKKLKQEWIKVSCDTCSKGNLCKASAGCIAIEHLENCTWAFTNYTGVANNFQVKLTESFNH